MDSLVPALDAFGLDGVFKLKEKQHEGLATFYRRSVLPSAKVFVSFIILSLSRPAVL